VSIALSLSLSGPSFTIILIIESLCIPDGFVAGDNVTYLASIAKLKTGRLSRQVVDECLQFFGGMGYTAELPISRAYRDVRVSSIAGGTDEIMLAIICQMMGILPKKKRKADQTL
jgi:citronellyl-CoA dehydrogenase